jgi:hypothetical protein
MASKTAGQAQASLRSELRLGSHEDLQRDLYNLISQTPTHGRRATLINER